MLCRFTGNHRQVILLSNLYAVVSIKKKLISQTGFPCEWSRLTAEGYYERTIRSLVCSRQLRRSQEDKAESVGLLVKKYRSLLKYPVLASAQLLASESKEEDLKVLSTWTQRNLEKGKISKFQQVHVIRPSSSQLDFLPVDISVELISRLSTSEKFRAVVREGAGDNNTKKQFLEVWEKGRLLKNFDVAAFQIHGDIYFDVEFGSFEWSPNEDKVLYIAEKKNVKSEPFYKQKSQETKDKEKSEDKPITFGEEYIYKPDWGEQLEDKHQPVVGVCDVNSETISVWEGIPSNFSPGQVQWMKGGDAIIGVVLENEPRQLGLIYCTNRLSYIFILNSSGEFKILSEEGKSVRSPRLSSDGNLVYWLQRPSGGPHDSCQELVCYNLVTQQKEILIPIVRRQGDFSGIYASRLPLRCFSKDGTRLFFNTINRTTIEAYSFDLVKRSLVKLPTENGSLNILDVFDDVILACLSSLQNPHSLLISRSIDNISWENITVASPVLPGSVVKLFEINVPNTKDSFTYFNALYFGPSPPADDGLIPLVVFPHGGPHSCFPNSFSLDAAFFVSLGMGVLIVNYRGSTGAGQDGVEFLLGKVSESDVEDCQLAVTETLKEISYIDSNKIVLYGGSHGGFLVVQLSAQYADQYKAVVARNPVIDVSAMFTISDIPDWCTVESGFNDLSQVTLNEVKKMFQVSPIAQVDKTVAPTLIMIGKKDLRVPCSQGLYLYNTLKARKIKTRLNVYDDNHPLAQVPVHLDSLINSGLWFLENLNISTDDIKRIECELAQDI